MDLLPSPTGESILGQTPYLEGGVRWDGGTFLHFACRKGMLDIVPPHLRKCSCAVPYRYGIDVQESFLQAWLFFGLLAELYGLNDEPSGTFNPTTHLDPSPNQKAGIDALYNNFKKPLPREAGGQGVQGYYLSAAEPEEAEKIRRHFVQKFGGGSGTSNANYMGYFAGCLKFVHYFLDHLDTTEATLRQSILTSIGGLGEAWCSMLRHLNPGLSLLTNEFGRWDVSYMKMSGEVEKKMLGRGWCKSDIEHIRQSFHGLATRHFLSNMSKPKAYDHKSCSVKMCTASQINSGAYDLAHDDRCSGGCRLMGIDQQGVKDILNETDSFPVLRLELRGHVDNGVMEIHVERYDENKPYVALSHVWADGLGNPDDNALPACQIDRLARLIQKLPSQEIRQEAKGQVTPGNQQRYWLWVDTLCCPMPLKEKRIALERIAAVYRHATHVLVLDKSITSVKYDEQGPEKAVENCLRIVGLATWMRRLWTLQEGALAKSLYFQFNDRAIRLDHECRRLLKFGSNIPLYYPIAQDVSLMFSRLRGLCSPSPSPSQNEDPEHHEREFYFGEGAQVQRVQLSLYFRNVSVASDEPLCITTLLSLDPRAMTRAGDCRQQRMAEVWKLLTEKCGRHFTARVIFYSDQSLGLKSLRGWRWAPKTLLPQLETGIDYDTAFVRFLPPTSAADWGFVTEYGIKVSFPGMMITFQPWAKNESSHRWPWSLFTRHVVDNSLFCRERTTGGWFKLSDLIRGQHIASWTWDEWRERKSELLTKDKGRPEGKRPSQPIFNYLRDGDHALIGPDPRQGSLSVSRVYLLAKRQDPPWPSDFEHALAGSLYVHACMPVSVTDVSESLWPGLDMVQGMARRIWKTEANQNLLHFLSGQGGCDPGPEDTKCQKILTEMREKMKFIAKEELAGDADGHLAAVAAEFMGQNWEPEDVWKMAIAMTPYELSAESLSGDRSWVVDGPVVGDGLCHEECCKNQNLVK